MGKTGPKQLAITLEPKRRALIEAAAEKAGHSLGEEVRQRLDRTFDDDGSDKPTLQLAASIRNLATLVRLQTSKAWHEHPAANRVMRHAITARLARLLPAGDPIFADGELPTARLVAPGSDDPEAMGLGLEAIDFHAPAMTPERMQRLDEMFDQTMKDLQKLHDKGEKS